MEEEKIIIQERIDELNRRMDELEKINQKLITEGRENEFDIRYGIEYVNTVNELYRQMEILEKFD